MLMQYMARLTKIYRLSHFNTTKDNTTNKSVQTIHQLNNKHYEKTFLSITCNAIGICGV